LRITGGPIQFGYLADYPESVPLLARWHHDEWSYLRPGDSIEARAARLRGHCGHQGIPTVVIALTEGALAGSAMLIAHDMDTRLELSPWLAGVFVAPEHRRQGVGASLVRRIIEEGTALGVPRLYLFTPSAERYYSRLGWRLVERTAYRGANVVVMCYEIRPKPQVG
jgi:predicted N-acetyltransferase YhbS